MEDMAIVNCMERMLEEPSFSSVLLPPMNSPPAARKCATAPRFFQHWLPIWSLLSTAELECFAPFYPYFRKKEHAMED